ncbi:hypothetical protein I553_2168 [Mycobacterium xenopi 4042]|uniref:Uncharacterized protein n=1 Tax=Mycobacterium xenopi 4042 TaxID=1299334 RepID=X8DNC9_MYCXE|nr:hypothetical protein I553_2168 [Mycobacterium xenopi 4042]
MTELLDWLIEALASRLAAIGQIVAGRVAVSPILLWQPPRCAGRRVMGVLEREAADNLQRAAQRYGERVNAEQRSPSYGSGRFTMARATPHAASSADWLGSSFNSWSGALILVRTLPR